MYPDDVAANRANWDERAAVHAISEMYDVEGLLADREALSQVMLNDLEILTPHLPAEGITGRSLLHLQCHIGTDTLSWARAGAVEVHGVDFSPVSLDHARRIARADGHDLTFVEADARFASAAVERSFEVVVTSAGTIVWLPELDDWARSIAQLLRPGGVFLVRDDHPILGALEFQPWTITDDYLSGGGMRSYDDDGTYTTGSAGSIIHTTNHEWRHSLAEVVGALRGAGLIIEELRELPYMDWRAFPELIECREGWRLPGGAPRIPLNFAVVARRAT